MIFKLLTKNLNYDNIRHYGNSKREVVKNLITYYFMPYQLITVILIILTVIIYGVVTCISNSFINSCFIVVLLAVFNWILKRIKICRFL